MQSTSTPKEIRDMHFEYSKKFPPQLVLHLQGSAILILRRRIQEVKNKNCFYSETRPYLSPSLLANPTEVLTHAAYLSTVFTNELDRNSPNILQQVYPQPPREQKGRCRY